MCAAVPRDEKKLNNLLSTWEEVFKRGLLSFWILLLLSKNESYAYEMAKKIREFSQGSISADEKSIYRALSRFEKFGILRSRRENSDIGPPRKYYFTTELGESLLEEFINRNIKIFYAPEMQESIFNIIDKAVIIEGEQHD